MDKDSLNIEQIEVSESEISYYAVSVIFYEVVDCFGRKHQYPHIPVFKTFEEAEEISKYHGNAKIFGLK